MSDLDMDVLAARMFGGEPAPVAPAPAATSPAEQTTGAPYTSEQIHAEKMFATAPILADAERSAVTSLSESGQFTPAEATQVVQEYQPLATDLGLNATEAKVCADVLVGCWRNEPTAEQVEGWRSASMDALSSEYGPNRIAEVLRRTQEYVAARPQLRNAVAGAAGNHPQVVRAIAARAMRS